MVILVTEIGLCKIHAALPNSCHTYDRSNFKCHHFDGPRAFLPDPRTPPLDAATRIHIDIGLVRCIRWSYNSSQAISSISVAWFEMRISISRTPVASHELSTTRRYGVTFKH
jgi:hypothetical protein